MEIKDIILRPLFSEKSLSLAGKGYYTFVVALHSDKGGIKKAFKELFDVTVAEVRTQRIKGQSKVRGKRRTKIKQPDYKKAVVKLKEGQKLTVFDLEEEKNEEGK